MRSRRGAAVVRVDGGVGGDTSCGCCRALVGQETYESGFRSELIKNKSRRSDERVEHGRTRD